MWASSSAAAAASWYIILLVTVSCTIASPLADCPESQLDQPNPTIVVQPPPLIPNPNSNDNILPGAPLSPPPAQVVGAPAEQEPLMQPSASANVKGGEELGEDDQGDKMNGNTGLAGTGAVGGALPLVDNTPFDSASSVVAYGFIASSSFYLALSLCVLF